MDVGREPGIAAVQSPEWADSGGLLHRGIIGVDRESRLFEDDMGKQKVDACPSFWRPTAAPHCEIASPGLRVSTGDIHGGTRSSAEEFVPHCSRLHLEWWLLRTSGLQLPIDCSG